MVAPGLWNRPSTGVRKNDALRTNGLRLLRFPEAIWLRVCDSVGGRTHAGRPGKRSPVGQSDEFGPE